VTDYKKLEADQQPTGQPEPMGIDVGYEMLYGTLEGLKRELEGVRIRLAQIETDLLSIMARADYVLDRSEFLRGPDYPEPHKRRK